jgi:hypothetical protein
LEHSTFPEAQHDLVKPLLTYQDEDLLILWQHNLENGKYLVAIFCRHSPLIYTLIEHSVSSEIKTNYIFNLVWREIFEQLPELELNPENIDIPELQSLSNWLIYISSLTIAEYESISEELIKDNLAGSYLPLKYYLEKTLDSLPPLHRLIMVMSEKFDWTPEQIMNYLEKQGETISDADLQAYLQESYQIIQALLPKDICSIYLV